MDAVFQYQIPELHPLTVHFPVALLVAAAFAGAVWLCRGSAFWRGVTWLLTGLGTVGAFFAYFTGDGMEEQAEGVPIVEELVGLHEQMALYTLIGACLATLLVTAQAWWSRRFGLRADPLPSRLLIAAVLIALGVLVAWTAHIGSTMVWGVAR
ncbi:MAG: DUF2231 domain-containing protein [Rhodothermales bacterium]